MSYPWTYPVCGCLCVVHICLSAYVCAFYHAVAVPLLSAVCSHPGCVSLLPPAFVGEGGLHQGPQDGGGQAVGHHRGVREENDRRRRAPSPRHRRPHRRSVWPHLGQGE